MSVAKLNETAEAEAMRRRRQFHVIRPAPRLFSRHGTALVHAVLLISQLIIGAMLIWGFFLRPAHGQAAMIYGTDAVSTPDPVSLPEPTELWFTQGNGTSINGTQVPSYWVNKVGGELSSAIQGTCAATLNMSVRNQLSTCITAKIAAIPTSGRLLYTVTYQSAGSYTVPTVAGVNVYDVEIIGGGGGGGGAMATDSAHISAGSGAAAGSAARLITTTSLAGVTVTVGAGGTAGPPGVIGGDGGASSIPGVVFCPGGGLGETGSGGTGFFGQIEIGLGGGACTFYGSATQLYNGNGQPGEAGLLLGAQAVDGNGAPSVYGGSVGNPAGNSGTAPTAAGAGGSGAACAASCPGYSGAAGAPGLVTIRMYN